MLDDDDDDGKLWVVNKLIASTAGMYLWLAFWSLSEANIRWQPVKNSGVLFFALPKDTCGVFGEGVEKVFLAHASMSHCLGMIVYANLSVDGNMRRWRSPNVVLNKLLLLTS